MGEAPEVAGATGADDEEDTSSAAPNRRRRAPAPSRGANDQRVITFMRNKVVGLESKLRSAELKLERLRSQPGAPFSQREEFLLGEIDLISRQLQGRYFSTVLRLPFSFCCADYGVLVQM